MSYLHTPEGFRKQFVQNLHQRGGAGMFKPPINLKSTDVTFPSFIYTEGKIPVERVSNKMFGNFFIYPVNKTVQEYTTNIDKIKADVEKVVQSVKGLNTVADLDTSLTSNNNKEIHVINAKIEELDGVKTIIFDSASDSKLDYDEFTKSIEDKKDVKKGILTYLSGVSDLTRCDPYIATNILEALEVPTYNRLFPISVEYYTVFLSELSSSTKKVFEGKEENLAKVLNVLAKTSDMYDGLRNFEDSPADVEDDVNSFLKKTRVHRNNYTSSIEASLEQKLNDLTRVIKFVGDKAFEIATKDNKNIEIYIQDSVRPNPMSQLYPLMMSRMRGGMPNQRMANQYRTWFSLKRTQLRGRNQDFREETFTKIQNLIDEIEKNETLLITYMDSLKNMVVDKSGKVNDFESFRNLLQKGAGTMKNVATKYVKMSDMINSIHQEA